MGDAFGNGCVNLKSFYLSYRASKQVIHNLYLKRITYSQGSVEFNTTPREDIEYKDPAKPPAKLAEILLKNLSGEVVKRYTFAYSYFTEQTDNGAVSPLPRRLKLDALTEYGADGIGKPPYRFTYNAPDALPSKFTKSIDYWGYYNGQPNTQLLPALLLTTPERAAQGANRKPDLTNLYPSRGVLADITYPTGGRTAFTYELHDYANLQEAERYIDAPRSVSAGINPNNLSGNNILQPIEEFDVVTVTTDPTLATIRYAYSEAGCRATGSCELEGVISGGLFFLEKQEGSSWRTIYTATNSFPPAGEPAYTQESGSATLPLTAGHYRARIFVVQGYSQRLDVSWADQVPVHQLQGGGLRIKAITNYEGGRVTQQRQFRYTVDGTPTGLSSGVLIAHPQTYFYLNVERDPRYTITLADPGDFCQFSATYLGRQSSSVTPLGFVSRSGLVSYSTVTEVMGAAGEGGTTQYTFANREDVFGEIPFVPARGDAWNGKMLHQAVYDAAGSLLKQTTYQYEEKESLSLQGAGIFQPAAIVNVPLQYRSYSLRFYQNPSSWIVPTVQQETVYDKGQAFVTTKSYAYDNALHKEVTQERVSTSNSGQTLLTRRLYPLDYASSGGFIEAMKAAHISLPVEQVSSVLEADGSNERVLSATLTTYLTGPKVGLADQQWTLETAVPVPLAQFKFTNQAGAGLVPTTGSPTAFNLTGRDGHYSAAPAVRMAYDAYGQLQQQQKAHGVPTAYLWSYAHALPVAQIQNASAIQVRAALQTLGADADALPTTEQTLRSLFSQLRQRLPQAQVTSLTHQPLVGVTSQTNPAGRTLTYEYDELQRLIRTRDEQGRILTQQQYHYAGK